jgi:hypothetical protein
MIDAQKNQKSSCENENCDCIEPCKEGECSCEKE